MSALAELDSLLYPKPFEIGAAWKRLTDWDALFDLCRRGLGEMREQELDGESRLSVAERWTEASRYWVEYFDTDTQRSLNSDDYALRTAPTGPALTRFRQFMALTAMLALRPEVGTDSSSLSAALREKPFSDMAPQHRARLSAWGRLLTGVIERRVNVAVPLVNAHVTPPKGFLGRLELTVLTQGTNTVYQHPADPVDAHETFATALRLAWQAAADDGERDGVWRLFGVTQSPDWAGQPLASPAGSSAGMAAARGWWHALHGREPDPDVVASGEIAPGHPLRPEDPDPQSFGFRGIENGASDEDEGWVRAKVEAVADDPRFDTLVMVDDERGNRAIVEQMRPDLRASLRVVWL
jgi:hypothetical protein